MAEMRFEDREIKLKIDKMISKIKDGSKLLEASFSIFGFKDIIDHFSNKQGPDGPWKPRAKTTDAFYDSFKPKGYSSKSPLLQQTGLLRNSTQKSNGQLKRSGKNQLTLIATANYSGPLDRGSSKKNLPARPFMWLGERAKMNIVRHITEEVAKA